MREVSIRFRPLPSSTWITHDPAFRTSIVSIESEAHKHPQPLAIIGAYLDGVPLRHRVLDALTVIVSPLVPLQGGYLEIRCLTPDLEPSRSAQQIASQGPQTVLATTPPPALRYGLQAPENRQKRGSL
jgi:hypothetical protein